MVHSRTFGTPSAAAGTPSDPPPSPTLAGTEESDGAAATASSTTQAPRAHSGATEAQQAASGSGDGLIRALVPVLDMFNHAGDEVEGLQGSAASACDNCRWGAIAPNNPWNRTGEWAMQVRPVMSACVVCRARCCAHAAAAQLLARLVEGRLLRWGVGLA